MAGQVVVTECPNCGAPIDPAALAGSADPKCPYCQHALPTRSAAPAWTPPATLRPAPAPGRRGCGLAALLVSLAAVGVVVAVLAMASTGTTTIAHSLSGLTGTSYTVTTPVVAVPDGAGFYAIAPTQGSSTNVLRRIDPLTRKVVWSSANLGPSAEGDPVVVAAPSQVFSVVGTTVLALDAATGHQVWQASLSNGLAFPCTSGCVVVAGHRLATLSKDGVVQAFDTATGAQTWSKRLNSTPRWLEAAGSSVVVADTTGTGPHLSVLVIDAQTGATRTIAPACAPSPNDPIGAARPTQADELFVSPDGAAVTALVADVGGCVVRYRLSDGAQMWRTPPQPDSSRIPFTLTGQSTLQDDANLLWTNDDIGGRQVMALNTATGAIRQLLNDRQDELSLVGIVGTTVVVKATPRYDPQKPAMVGLDLTTGTQKWRVGTRVATSNDNQGEFVTRHAAMVVSCNSEANTCRFEAVDPQIGTIIGSSVVSADPAQQEEVHVVTTSTSMLVTAGWNHVVGIDPATAAIQWKWPA